jgi:hypothetical protein
VNVGVLSVNRCKIKETLIHSEFPATPGCIAIFEDCKSLKMQQDSKSHFEISIATEFTDEFSRVSLKASPHVVLRKTEFVVAWSALTKPRGGALHYAP